MDEQPEVVVKKKKKSLTLGQYIILIIWVGSFGAYTSLNRINNEKNQTQSIEQILKGQWVSFNSPEANFSIDFPKSPTKEINKQKVNDIDISTTTYYLDLNENDTYIVSFIPYPSQFDLSKDFHGVLEGSMNGAVNTTEGNKLISSEYKSILNYPAVEYKIHNTKQDIYLKAREIVVGQNMYQIMVGSKTDSQPYFERFANSFKLK